MSEGYLREGSLTVEQCVELGPFVEWMYDRLALIRTNSPIKPVTQVHPVTGVETFSRRFFTRRVLRGFNHIRYKPTLQLNGTSKNVKYLPKNVSGFFSPTAIAVWYAGDGTKILDGLGVKFEVTSFSEEGRLHLKDLFMKKHGIRTEIIKSGFSKKGTQQWALKVLAEEYSKFHDLVTQIDLIPTLFAYKLHY